MMKSIILILMMVVISSLAMSQDYVLIVNSSNGSSSISKKEASDFFLKKKTKWSDGKKVVAVDQKGKSSVRASFSKAVHGKPTSAIKSYWQQALFSGKGVPPAEKASDAEVVAFVKANTGAVGYVAKGSNTTGTKVLKLN